MRGSVRSASWCLRLGRRKTCFSGARGSSLRVQSDEQYQLSGAFFAVAVVLRVVLPAERVLEGDARVAQMGEKSVAKVVGAVLMIARARLRAAKGVVRVAGIEVGAFAVSWAEMSVI